MCGIVGMIGNTGAKEILLKGLEKLEYRGYDSAGLALMHDNVNVHKEVGRIAALREVVPAEVDGLIGIGHTRWATHGVPSVPNAHPHQSTTGRFTLVHNGVIENDEQIKATLDAPFLSETDTEVIVQLMEKNFVELGDVESAFRKTLSELHGSYAIAMIDSEDRERLYIGKNKSPLLVGLGDGTFNVVASDAMAMLQVTDQYLELHDGEIVILTRESATIKTLDGDVLERAPYTAEIDASDIEKGTYAHYMLKEMDEQPAVIRNIIQHYQNDNGDIELTEGVRSLVSEADRIYIVACGTSYHAGLVGKQLIERVAGVPTEVHVASEFGYNMPLLTEKPLFLFISQSGETADSRAVLVEVKKRGYKALTLTNVAGSTLSREANETMLLHAGPEIAVASTKAYTAQIAVLAILAYDIARANGKKLPFDLMTELARIATIMDSVMAQKEIFEQLADKFLKESRNAFFLGRGMDSYVGLEGALKLKEISYIQAEGYPGGELKHGPIALIEDGTPVITLVSQPNTHLNIRGNIKEVVARGAVACTISMEGMEHESDSFVLPRVEPLLTPLVTVLPLQLISYYAALARDCDVDKPRNLAKSVTVE
ncbi:MULTISPECIES: glutamine--fructose-6-phosphate transaminase (isomerizing) [unclassified Exiguobacterium]|uniref:glutamine--fructose-6-phosphate transaminase (isomerizing) n=1 Tax=unclassified Exiguobacterium TaxID=2644629 RepID=UPI0010407A03|nr:MULTISPECIES: glutamine--fructose-6-phosphate transaminase (isomerizing) [unclassified Exiguobacterium]TCI36589.1 glutamine--fructose-6-phosphate transaminase (isomerizing) [Exiguobacterium sp. SH4S7]TCI48641.1 glutamine--fructose-6-phosphate transaminase (isomerizing) [Exiguobacterium sp. SH5S32]TCI55527.1 glutamine--fructose-6-phosphate transaminase (isomerizing) [Exiguobacterium sp. SH1S4]TCI75324.1 glutamine--fructose-6-phosphate transaminase (isomerizing) [Exiguobacterium sp. SH1S1]